jgi:hypothetical protein
MIIAGSKRAAGLTLEIVPAVLWARMAEEGRKGEAGD